MRSFISAGSATLDAGVTARLAAAKSTTTESRRTIPTNVRPWVWKVPSLKGFTAWAWTSRVETMHEPKNMAITRFMLILLFMFAVGGRILRTSARVNNRGHGSFLANNPAFLGALGDAVAFGAGD